MCFALVSFPQHLSSSFSGRDHVHRHCWVTSAGTPGRRFIVSRLPLPSLIFNFESKSISPTHLLTTQRYLEPPVPTPAFRYTTICIYIYAHIFYINYRFSLCMQTVQSFEYNTRAEILLPPCLGRNSTLRGRTATSAQRYISSGHLPSIERG